jgi:hypothetical protein
MAAKWKFMMRCPAGSHLFEVQPDTIMKIPDACPECVKAQMTWWRKRKTLKAFRSQLERFVVDPPEKPKY